MKKPEILAPAGNKEQLIAAVQTGANAVYLGTSSFSARAGAGNFALDEMSQVIDYCHEYGVKVYVALNILLKDSELPEAIELAKDLWERGIDALIVTDPGLMSELRRMPEIELHASTQTSIHHPKQAAFYQSIGITRAILARELSAREIKAITGVMDCEIFIQGALCISYSGQCLMSSMFGGRSGNRGRCAQPCRLTYQLQTSDKLSDKSHRLSPKDLSLLPKTNEIQDIGVVSLKIEGRLRSPAYVIEAIKAYRQALDGETTSLRGLELTFNRGGYTQEYLEGTASHQMMARHTPKHQGRRIGVAGDLITLEEAIAVGDGLTSGEDGFRVEQIKRNGQSIQQASAGDKVEILPKKYQANQPLYKNFDVTLHDEAQSVIREPYGRKQLIPVEVTFKVGSAFTLRSGDTLVQGDIVQEALKAPLSSERIQKALEKSGDYPFAAEVSFRDYEAGFLPMGAINQTRRDLFDALRERTVIRRNRPAPSLERFNYQPKTIPESMIILRRSDHLAFIQPCDTVCLNPFYQDQGSLTKREVENFTRPFWLHLPTILRDEYDETIAWVRSLPLCQGIVTANVTALAELSDYLRIGDAKLNLMNSLGADLYQLDGYLPSEELNRGEISQLKNLDQVMMSLYSRAELMLMDYCQTRTGYPCKKPCNHQPIGLVDRLGETISIAHDIFCRSHLLNPKRKNLFGQRSEMEQFGVKSFLVELTDESMEEAEQVLDALRNRSEPMLPDVTYGHYRRGVE